MKTWETNYFNIIFYNYICLTAILCIWFCHLSCHMKVLKIWVIFQGLGFVYIWFSRNNLLSQAFEQDDELFLNSFISNKC